MSQTERILFIDRKLQNEGDVTVNQVASRFEVSTRQIKRDIEYLRDRFNAPIVWDSKRKVYFYEKKFKTLAFADQKLVLFYVIMKSLSENQHYIPIYTDDLLSRISGDVPSDYRSVCNKISYEIPQSEFINPEYFVDICDSMRDKKCLDIEYLNLKNELSSRIVECERIINYSGSWYMICYDFKRSDLRTFHISRVQSIKQTKLPFHIPEQGYEEKLKDFISSSFGIFKGVPSNSATIRFYEEASRIVSTQIWHPEQTLVESSEFTPDHENKSYVELTLPVSNFTEIISKILAFGHLAKPVSPPELCAQWKAEIEKMASFI